MGGRSSNFHVTCSLTCAVGPLKDAHGLLQLTVLLPDLTHWGRATHICVGKLTIIGSDNGLSPVRRQAIIWTIAGILLIGPLGTNFSEILIGIQTFSFRENAFGNVVCEMASICLGLNVLIKGFIHPNYPMLLYWQWNNPIRCRFIRSVPIHIKIKARTTGETEA